MTRVVAKSDVVITTAAIPGRTSPVLVPGDAVGGMDPGSVIVDLAAERGGNCELTRADQRVDHQHTLLGKPARECGGIVGRSDQRGHFGTWSPGGCNRSAALRGRGGDRTLRGAQSQ